MARSSYKTILHPNNLQFLKIQKHCSNMYNRGDTITTQHIYNVYFIHNGKRFIRKRISPLMIGHKFGEFALTRKIINARLKLRKIKKK